MTNQLPIDLPPSSDELLGMTTCGCAGCTTMMKQSQAIIGVIRVGRRTWQEHFCSLDCRDIWRDYMTPGVRYAEH